MMCVGSLVQPRALNLILDHAGNHIPHRLLVSLCCLLDLRKIVAVVGKDGPCGADREAGHDFGDVGVYLLRDKIALLSEMVGDFLDVVHENDFTISSRQNQLWSGFRPKNNPSEGDHFQKLE